MILLLVFHCFIKACNVEAYLPCLATPHSPVKSTPSEPEQQDYDVGVSEDEISTLVEEVTPHEEPPEPPKVWSPYDEPSIPEDAVTEEETETEVDETEPLEEGDDEPVITEPPLPPPPESEEDEEERKRRARRLFFGA